MRFLVLLSVITILYAWFGAAIWMRARNIAFPIGLGLLYYWTLYGAWFLTVDQMRGYSSLRYQYLFAKLFPVFLDDSYFLTLAVYGLFLLSIEAGLALTVRPPRLGEFSVTPVMSHAVMLTVGYVTGIGSFLIIRNSIAAANQMNVSSYEFVRMDGLAGGAYKIHQILMNTALFISCSGFAVIASGRRARAIISNPPKLAVPAYALLFAFLFYVNYRLGQRREVAMAMIAGGLFYLVNTRRPRWLLIGAGACFMVVAMGVVAMTRGGALAARSATEVITSAMTENLVSNEPFAAHMSLYGTIAMNVPATWGSSLVYLATSMVPGARRPMDTYEYYSMGVKAVEGQGFTVHQATGWYLNFGTPGVIAGGALIGFIWGGLFSAFFARERIAWHVVRMLVTFAPWMFTAALPTLIRGGPESYKGLMMGFAPVFVAIAATLRPVSVGGTPTLAPALVVTN